MINKVRAKFLEQFNNVDDVKCFFSPGRVNIIGEHIDYNGGYVLPCAISLGTYFVIRLNNLNQVRAYSLQFPELGLIQFPLEDADKQNNWTDFIKGIIQIYNIKSGFDVVCGGTIPHSSGLSSSASFTTGLAYALKTLLNQEIQPIQLAIDARRVENEFMGVNCGIMDQFIVCNGKKNQALLLNCNTLEYQEIPFELGQYSLIIANTNKKRQLTDSKYNERKAECEKILEIVQKNGYEIDELCKLKEKDLQNILPLIADNVLQKRFRHVVSENLRTLQAADALKKGDILLLGELLCQSHLSLKNDYEVSGIELDTLVEGFLKQEGCIGARMTGAGFGGCAIALVKTTHVAMAKANVEKYYLEKIGYLPSFYEVDISDSQRKI